jgi:arsenate reductase-like glutaredoxin family protein
MAENIVLKIFADDRTKRAFASVGAGLSKMAKAAAAFGVAATGATAALTISAARSADQLAKTADKIGATTEALAGLQYAAELSGVSTETMNMALQRMTRRVSEAALGTGEAKGALRELGIEAGQLQQLPLDDQLGVIADAMQEVGSQSDRVRLAMKLFDSEGVALVNTLKGGSAELEKMALEADLLGLAISRTDAAKIEQANDAILGAQKVFVGLGNQLAAEFAPIITGIATDFRQTAIENAEFGNIGQKVAAKLIQGYGAFRDGLLGIEILFMKLKAAGLMFGGTIVGVFSEVGAAIDFLVEKYNAVAESAFGQALGMEPIIVNAERAMRELSQGMFEQASDIQSEILRILDSEPPSKQINHWYEELGVTASETAETVKSATEGMNMSFKEMTEAQQQSALAAINTILSTTQTQMGALQNVFTEGSAAAKAFFVVQQALAAGSAIVNGLMASMSIRAAYAQLAAATGNPALAAAGEVHAKLAMAMGFATAGMIAGQTIASFEGGGFTGFGARAGGIDGRGGMPAILHPNETVIDHTKGQGAANVNFNISAMDASSFDEMLVRRKKLLVGLINDAVMNNGRRAIA